MLTKQGQIISLSLLDDAALRDMLVQMQRDIEGYERFMRSGKPGQIAHEVAGVKWHDAKRSIEEIQEELRNREI